MVKPRNKEKRNIYNILMTWFFHEHKWKRKHNPKLQATSRKPHAPIFRSLKQQAQPEVASDKPQASSTKRR
jgi:hypothetical protein